MINIIDNYYLTTDKCNMKLYEERMVQPLNKEKEASLKMVELGNYNPYLNQGFKSVHQKLLALSVEESELTTLTDIIEFLDVRSELILERFDGMVLKGKQYGTTYTIPITIRRAVCPCNKQ